MNSAESTMSDNDSPTVLSSYMMLVPGKSSRTESDLRLVANDDTDLGGGKVCWESADVTEDLPVNAFLAESTRFKGEHHYVARHNAMECDSNIPTFIGPLIKGSGLLRVPRSAGDPPLKSYEILMIDGDATWRPPNVGRTGRKTLPNGAIPVLAENKVKIFIGKMKGIGVGTVKYNTINKDWEFFTHEREQSYTDRFEVLCLNEWFMSR